MRVGKLELGRMGMGWGELVRVDEGVRGGG